MYMESKKKKSKNYKLKKSRIKTRKTSNDKKKKYTKFISGPIKFSNFL